MNRVAWMLVFALFFIGWISREHFRSARSGAEPARLISSAVLAGGAEPLDPCYLKRRCVVAYVAPWCGACKALMPKFLQLRDLWMHDDTRGFKLLVGKDRPEKKQSLAMELGVGAYVDGGDMFAKKMHVEHFPTLFVLGERDEVLAVDLAAFNWVSEQTKGIFPTMESP